MLASGVVAGVLLGIAIGRDPHKLSQVHIRFWSVVFVALAARLVAPFLSPLSLALDLTSVGLIGMVAFANWRIPGAAVIGAGSILNFVVIAANGGMPVDTAQLASVGGAFPIDGLHLALSPSTRLGEFADVIILSPFGAAYSVGDLLIAAGGFLLPFINLTRQ